MHVRDSLCEHMCVALWGLGVGWGWEEEVGESVRFVLVGREGQNGLIQSLGLRVGEGSAGGGVSHPLEKMEVEEFAARTHPGLCHPGLLRCAGVGT